MTTRRDFFLTAAGAGAAAAAAPSIPADLVRRHDDAVDRYIGQQVTDPASRWSGGIPDATGLYGAGATGGLLSTLGTAFLYEGSRHHGLGEVLERMRLGVNFIGRGLSQDGNISLLSTNFNSPPDTAFMTLGLAPLLRLGQRNESAEIKSLMTPLLKRCGEGLAKGGVHTPNHRWVVCSALAQLSEVLPNPAYARRVDQWLAEGIDIDADGQYTERSTSVYDPAIDRALVVVAHKLNKPELLDPVRRNLDSLLYLLHPNDEVVTEISRRQDQYQRGKMHGYWFPLQYLAVRDNNGRYAALAAKAEAAAMSLPVLLEYPELTKPVTPTPLRDDYEKQFDALGITHIRRGATSATLVLAGSSRFFTLRRGDAVLTAIRFASAFFGKGQFVPTRAVKEGDTYHFTQELSAGYYQPLEHPRTIAAGQWGSSRSERKVTELCELRQSATVRETKNGFDVRIRAEGTRDVPVTIELAFAAGGKLGEGSYRAGADEIRFGPMLREHNYTTLRGAEPPIPGQQCAYLTALTPVDHTIHFEWT